MNKKQASNYCVLLNLHIHNLSMNFALRQIQRQQQKTIKHNPYPPRPQLSPNQANLNQNNYSRNSFVGNNQQNLNREPPINPNFTNRNNNYGNSSPRISNQGFSNQRGFSNNKNDNYRQFQTQDDDPSKRYNRRNFPPRTQNGQTNYQDNNHHNQQNYGNYKHPQSNRNDQSNNRSQQPNYRSQQPNYKSNQPNYRVNQIPKYQNNQVNFEKKQFINNRGALQTRQDPYFQDNKKNNFRNRQNNYNNSNLNHQSYEKQIINNQQPQNYERQTYRGRGANRGNRGRHFETSNFESRGRGNQRPTYNKVENEQRGTQKYNPLRKQKFERVIEKKVQKKEDSFINDEEDEQNIQNGQEQQEEQQQFEQQNEDEQQEQQIEQRLDDEEQQKQTKRRQVISVGQNINETEERKIDEMCGYEQFQDRQKNFKDNNPDKNSLRLNSSFSIFQINRLTKRPDFNLTIKKYVRSAGGREDDDGEANNAEIKDVGRSIKGLIATINHINKEVIDSDRINPKYLCFPLPPNEDRIEFIHIFHFLYDRMRQMIKDITRLTQEEKMTKPIIEMSEQIARFSIMAINEGRKKYVSELQFDEKTNLGNLTKILTLLMEIYAEIRIKVKALVIQLQSKNVQLTIEMIESQIQKRQIYISPNESQICAYAIIISTDYRKSLYENVFYGFEGDDNPLFNSKDVQIAIEVQRSLKNFNYQQFFSILEDKSVDYVLSCVMLSHLQKVREKTIQILFKAWKYKEENTLDYNFTKEALRFKENQDQEFKKFLKTVNAKANQQQTLIKKQHNSDDNVYIPPYYEFDVDKLDRNIYTTQKPKKIVYQPDQITRGELVSRSWKKDDFDKKLIRNFLGQNEEAPPTLPLRIVSQKQDIASEKNKQRAMLEEMRAEMKKKNKRKLFLENIEKQFVHILELCRGDHQCRKKSVNMMSDVIESMQLNLKLQSFDKIINHCLDKAETQRYFQALHDYSKSMKKLKNMKIQQSKTVKNNSYSIPPLSVFKQKINQTNQIDSFHLNQHIAKIFTAKNIQQRKSSAPDAQSFRILLIVQNNINQSQIEFLSKLWGLLTNEHQAIFKNKLQNNLTFNYQIRLQYCQKIQENIKNEKHIDYGVTFLKIENNNGLNIQGRISQDLDELIPGDFPLHEYNGMIIVQFYNNMKGLLIELNSYGDLKDQNVTNKFSIPILCLSVETHAVQIWTTQQYNQQYPNLDIQVENLILKTQRHKPSIILKIKIKDFFAKVIQCLQKMPQVEVKPLNKIIKDIICKMPQVNKFIHPSFDNSFFFYQEYINTCFQLISQFESLCLNNYELIPNWSQILTSLTSEPYSHIRRTTSLQRQYLTEMFRCLSMQFLQKCFWKKKNVQPKDLIEGIVSYLKYFNDQENTITELRRIFGSLRMSLGKVQGNCYELFKWILQRLSYNLKSVNVILPLNFRIYLDPNLFKQRVERVSRYQVDTEALNQKKQKLIEDYKRQYKAERFHKQMPPWIKNQYFNVVEDCLFVKTNEDNKRTREYYSDKKQDQFVYDRKNLLESLRKMRKV